MTAPEPVAFTAVHNTRCSNLSGFCFGHLIHSGLMLGYQIVYLRAEGQEFYNCASIATLLLDVLYPLYSFLQLFFIFKYSNVSANIDSNI
jgi:hypothetical protein